MYKFKERAAVESLLSHKPYHMIRYHIQMPCNIHSLRGSVVHMNSFRSLLTDVVVSCSRVSRASSARGLGCVERSFWKGRFSLQFTDQIQTFLLFEPREPRAGPRRQTVVAPLRLVCRRLGFCQWPVISFYQACGEVGDTSVLRCFLSVPKSERHLAHTNPDLTCWYFVQTQPLDYRYLFLDTYLRVQSRRERQRLRQPAILLSQRALLKQ